MKSKSPKYFRNWTAAEIEIKLGVELIENAPILNDFIHVNGIIPASIEPTLEQLRQKLKSNHTRWNEQELVFHFIAPLVFTINFGGKWYRLYLDRELKGNFKGHTIEGNVDGVVASGINAPEVTYFFFHEYKRFKMGDSEPLGQVLIEMLVALANNLKNSEDHEPVYGCYVYGSTWKFVVAWHENKENEEVQFYYSISDNYDSLKSDDLHQIWRILNNMKNKAKIRGEQELVRMLALFELQKDVKD